MRSQRARVCEVVLGQLMALSALAAGQTITTSSLGNVDRQFSAIHTSLALAADSALNAVRVEKPFAGSIDRNPESTTPRTSEPERTVRTKSTRLDALRPIIQSILTREGVPENLADVIQVESAGDALALSPKGARGLWQLMPETARRYGLKLDSRTDERIDVEKSTRAAGRYLRDLYAQFGSWPLALAAYNAGENRLQHAIDRAGSNDFATLSMLRYIPDETRNYVPAVLAAMETPSLELRPSYAAMKPATFVYAPSAPQDTPGPAN